MKTAVFVGHAGAPSHSVTGQISKVIQVVMEIDKVNGTIVSADVNVASPVSRGEALHRLRRRRSRRPGRE